MAAPTCPALEVDCRQLEDRHALVALFLHNSMPLSSLGSTALFRFCYSYKTYRLHWLVTCIENSGLYDHSAPQPPTTLLRQKIPSRPRHRVGIYKSRHVGETWEWMQRSSHQWTWSSICGSTPGFADVLPHSINVEKGRSRFREPCVLGMVRCVEAVHPRDVG